MVKIAMPAGEVDGCAAIVSAALKSQFAPELKSGKLRILAQWGFTKDPDLADVPLFPTGKTEADRQFLQVLYARQDYGRPFFTPPDVPAARIAALRTAFERIFKDDAFLDAVRKQNLDLNYVSGDTLASMIDKVMSSPPEVVERLHAVLGF